MTDTQISSNTTVLTTTTDTFDIIAIYPNDLNLTAANYQSHVPDILKCCKIIRTTQEDLMYVLYDLLEMNEDTIGDSDIIYENGSLIYQLFHNSENLCASEESSKLIKIKSSNDILKNSVSTTLVNSNKKVNGVGILVCSRIQPNLLCTTHSITLFDTLELLKKTFEHIGNIIGIDDSIIPFTYQSPLDGIEDNKKSNYSYIESTVYNLHLIGCYDTIIETVAKNYNKKASLLLGTNVYGNVRICLSTDTKFLDIEDDLMNNLIYCCLHSDEKKYDMTEDLPERSGGMSLVKNHYTLLKRRASKFQVPCCNKSCKIKCNIDKNTISDYVYKCNDCYNAFYHDQNCMDNDKNAHRENCPGSN